MSDKVAEILIVDDKPANLRLLAQVLTEHGYQVRAMTSGARALESALATPPDLILLDVRMPEMDGFAVCAALKAQAQTRDIPIIFISALDSVDDKIAAFRLGGVDYVTKPFQPDEVLARTETHLALRGLQRRLQESNRRYQRELALAGQIQASFLPQALPTLPGWQLAARLIPSRETSGDFFDVVALPEGRWGFLIADVADKGVGAALFMALCWGLIRTYLARTPTAPARVFEAVNRRLLRDTTAGEFVTVFLGVLDATTGRLTYANAGHCPALFASAGQAPERCRIQRLRNTGAPLGVLETMTWTQHEMTMHPGDTLLLYTDGISEAQSTEGQFFCIEGLETVMQASQSESATGLLEQVLRAVDVFSGGKQPESDDIAVLALRRDGGGSEGG